MLLTKVQAKAVADAMCRLNNVGGKINCTIDSVKVCELPWTGRVLVRDALGAQEEYVDQNAFMYAYGVHE